MKKNICVTFNDKQNVGKFVTLCETLGYETEVCKVGLIIPIDAVIIKCENDNVFSYMRKRKMADMFLKELVR